MTTRFCAQLALVTVLGLSGAAHAALQGRDLNGSIGSFEAYYDTDLDITAMAVPTSNLGVTWVEANSLVANFSITVGANVYANWRLPTAQLDASCLELSSGSGNYYGCTGSELGHLFVIENLESAGALWSATESAPEAAWLYNSNSFVQSPIPKGDHGFVLAVHSGDVAAVPEADSWAMLLAGLGLVGVAARRRRG